MYDYLIVGAGFFGSVFAHEATAKGKKCLVIDRRNHIGGNAYSYKDHGIDIHKYGPHIFHTNEKRLWDYINKFGNFVPYFNRGKVIHDSNIYSFPINLMTFNQLWGVKTPEEARRLIESKKVKISNPKNMEEYVLSQVGEEIYNIFIKGYTTKQWGRSPKDLPVSIIKRIPIRYHFNEFSVDDIYQGVPEEGYDTIFLKMLEGIDVEVGVDYFSNRNYYNSKAKKIVFTGCIDEFFDYKYGALEYRSLSFTHETHQVSDYQGNTLINYANEEIPYTRVCEHRHFLPHLNKNLNSTVVTREYPSEWKVGKEAYYPINDIKNTERYKLYREEAEKSKDTIFGGRLAEYRYYDMHQVLASALKAVEKV